MITIYILVLEDSISGDTIEVADGYYTNEEAAEADRDRLNAEEDDLWIVKSLKPV